MSSSQKARLLYKVNKLGPRNTKKILELTKDFAKLLERMKKEGKTTWMVNALGFARARLNRAGFSDQTIEKKYTITLSDIFAKGDKAPKKKAAPAAKVVAPKTTPAKKPAAAKKAAPKKAPTKKAA